MSHGPPLLTAGLAAGLATLAICCAAPAATPPPSVSAAAAPNAFAVNASIEHLGVRPLWPGFDPRRIPIAIYDGKQTVIFRHPSPPLELEAISGRSGAVVYPGRHQKVISNTSEVIGGVLTATLRLDGDAKLSADEHAATGIHELFHVHQRRTHPTWVANEMDAFTYPVEREDVLAARRIETEALRRALTERTRVGAACWARAAMAARAERFGLLSKSAVAYERMNELNEGLAQYIQARVIGRGVELPAHDFPADQVRLRTYMTGAAIALLLDRCDPTWRDVLEHGDPRSLDELLAAAAQELAPDDCRMDADTIARLRHEAEDAIADLARRRTAERAAFLAQRGFRIEVDASRSPLQNRGFDPQNVSRVTAAEVLHRRHVKLGGPPGEIEVIDRPSLTESAGEHPLFSGVKTLIIPGLRAEPRITEAAGTVTIEAEGVHATLKGASLERGPHRVKIILRADLLP